MKPYLLNLNQGGTMIGGAVLVCRVGGLDDHGIEIRGTEEHSTIALGKLVIAAPDMCRAHQIRPTRPGQPRCGEEGARAMSSIKAGWAIFYDAGRCKESITIEDECSIMPHRCNLEVGHAGHHVATYPGQWGKSETPVEWPNKARQRDPLQIRGKS